MRYSFLALWRFLLLLFGRRLDVIFIFYDSSVGVASNHTRVVHEIGAIKPSLLTIFWLD